MKQKIRFRSQVIILFVGSLIPLLLLVGILVYRLQQAYLLEIAQQHLVEFVQAEVEQYSVDDEMTLLAVNLSENLRVLGADMFLLDASGQPVPPSLGTGPWLSAEEHRQARENRLSRFYLPGSGSDDRIIYLAAVVDDADNVLGSVEASVPVTGINEQLDGLRRWLILITTLAAGIALLMSIILSGVLTRPIKRLVNAADSVRKGNLEQRAPMSEVYELDELATAFNLMLDRISADLEERARQAENMRQFAADVSHELRSPLTVFRNSVDLMQKAVQQNDSQQIPNILALLEKEVDSMSTLVGNLLLLSRLEQSDLKTIARPAEVHPFPLLEEVYERSQMLARGHEIKLVWPQEEIGAIWGDRNMILHALNNVAENALLYTPPGKNITLSLEDNDRYCAFVIEDEGVGMTPEQLSKIFERFYRSDESRNRRKAGSGLGLPIVDAIMRAHHGDIQVESEVGKGTRFKLLFRKMVTPF